MIDDDAPEGLPLRYHQPGYRQPARMRWWEAVLILLCVAFYAALLYAAVFGPFPKPW